MSPMMFYIAQTENNLISVERIKSYLNNQTENLSQKPE